MKGIGYVLVSAAVFTADQLGKRSSRQFHTDGNGADTGKVIGRGRFSVRLCHHRNRGLAMNKAENHSTAVKWINILLLAVMIPLFLILLGRKGHGTVKTGAALLIGGGLSNLCDRIRDGYVTDYIRLRFGPKRLRQIIFNLGDCAILIGAVLTIAGSASGDS